MNYNFLNIIIINYYLIHFFRNFDQLKHFILLVCSMYLWCDKVEVGNHFYFEIRYKNPLLNSHKFEISFLMENDQKFYRKNC